VTSTRLEPFRPAALAAVLGFAVLLGGLSARAGEGDEGPKPPAKASLPWMDGFEAGVAQGRKDGRLLFVYVARHKPT
jgi:hypothetical protein